MKGWIVVEFVSRVFGKVVPPSQKPYQQEDVRWVDLKHVYTAFQQEGFVFTESVQDRCCGRVLDTKLRTCLGDSLRQVGRRGRWWMWLVGE